MFLSGCKRAYTLRRLTHSIAVYIDSIWYWQLFIKQQHQLGKESGMSHSLGSLLAGTWCGGEPLGLVSQQWTSAWLPECAASHEASCNLSSLCSQDTRWHHCTWPQWPCSQTPFQEGFVRQTWYRTSHLNLLLCGLISGNKVEERKMRLKFIESK